MTHEQFFCCFAGKVLRTMDFSMSEDDCVDSFTTAHAVPIE